MNSTILAVVKVNNGKATIKFQGTREECYDYMRKNHNWTDLIHVQMDGSLGRMSSWVL